MFFPEKIVSIKPSDKVLEIGPGGSPYPRADILLEKRFQSEGEAKGQRGHAPELNTSKKIIYYEGDYLPFNDKSFDYVICSHVVEHVDNVEVFIGELQRIASKGYIEFPTVYYDFIYNFPEHVTLLFYRENKIFYMSKEESNLNVFKDIQRFFYESLKAKYSSLVNELKPFFFQGFEWLEKIEVKKALSFSEITFNCDLLKIPRRINYEETGIVLKIKNKLRTAFK